MGVTTPKIGFNISMACVDEQPDRQRVAWIALGNSNELAQTKDETWA